MAQKPSIPRGTRDFNAEEVAKRSYIMSVIKEKFELYGFQPIETPSFENLSTLTGKYGEEGDNLIFKILNSGDKVKKADVVALENGNLVRFSNSISEKALRYDLTVPFARYVVQHQNDFVFPFKRYQIQPVWRADRPANGRFREFYQCDADVVGSKSLFQEVEFIQLYDAVFTALELEGVTIKINNRKILSGIAEVIGAQDKLIDFTVALDKLDKIGGEKVKEEMRSKGISEEGISQLQPLFELKGDFGAQIERLKSILSTSEIGSRGIEELEFINTVIATLGLKTAKLQLDVTLARGLNYYTGAIFEVSAPESVKIGSIGGGGRYDDLTSIFGKPDTSGVGISFGLDRIYLVLEELNLFPETITEATKVLFISFGKQEAMMSLQTVSKLRTSGVKAELFPDEVTSGRQMKKQMTYANRRKIPYVVLVGEEELNSEMFTLKTMETGEQQTIDFDALLNALK
ncbi:histidine--tRNA ligase [Winogradskyella sp.]|uniref:histidine--tRNA ligase n=1 Tax=Winogradskyella sp. TaxID=1883156 RepID=UPI00262D7F01|nr:histidine--tRNA ligase [Winogradskyella sp.]